MLARYPDFRRLFVANSLSLLGSSVTTVALPLTAVVYLHASPVQMGLLGAVALLPHLAPRRRRMPADIVDGLRAVFTHPVLRVVTLAATIGAFASQLQNVVLVLYLVRDLGLSAALVGVVVAIGGAGGVVGALLATRITRRIGPGPAFITGMFPAGIVLAAAAGALLGGLLGSTLNLRATLIVGSAVMLAGAAIAYLSPLRSLRRLPARHA